MGPLLEELINSMVYQYIWMGGVSIKKLPDEDRLRRRADETLPRPYLHFPSLILRVPGQVLLEALQSLLHELERSRPEEHPPCLRGAKNRVANVARCLSDSIAFKT